jgi:CheY-like chemotaxis protein
LWVQTDEKLMYRVLQNLTSNAIRYTEKGGVLVLARKHQQGVQIMVLDTGVGLNESEQAEIFNEFKRFNKTADIVDKGLGLGMSIVDRIVKQLAMPLTIRSIPNRGSSFILNVPLAQAQPNQVVTEVDNWVSQTLSKQQKTVLCIDNEPQILNGMQQLLSGWGLQAHGAEGSVQAKELLNQGVIPDLLLVDYQLNDELGTDVVVDLFKQYELQCPVILITANHSEELKSQVKNAGYYLLLKPLKPIKLRQLFNQLM